MSGIDPAARSSHVAGVAAAPGDPWIGHVLLGRYRITEFLSAGGMSRVYRAQQQMSVGPQLTQRPVAVKILHDHLARNGAETQQFIHEINLMATLSSPYLASFYEAGRTDAGHIFVVMELVQGMTLREALHDPPRPLPVGRALQIAAQVGRALKTLHDAGVFHRDVKPENVMVGADGAVKLLDLGIAKIVGQRGAMTQAGMLAGTPSYMAPEQLRGEPVDARCDVYSLAVLTSELLTGALPFAMARPQDGQGMLGWLPVHCGPRLPFPAQLQLPAHVEAALRRALDPDPARRPSSMGELLLLLEGPSHTEVHHAMHSHHPPGAPQSRELMFLAGGVFLALGLVGAFGLGMYFNRTQPKDSTAAVTAPPLPSATPTPTPITTTPAAPGAPVAAPVAAQQPTTVAAAARDPIDVHDNAYRAVLEFHYARVGGSSVRHQGQLSAADDRYLSLNGEGDALTLVAPEGYEFVSDGNPAVPEVEVDVHPHDRAQQSYEVDVSYEHRDTNDPGWIELARGEAHAMHNCDIDHVRQRSARYLRIRNTSNVRVDIDAVYVRRLNPCSNPALCRNVRHGI